MGDTLTLLLSKSRRTPCSTIERDRWIAEEATLLRGALEKKFVKSRSSGCLNWDASIPLSILLLVAVVADGVDNAPVVVVGSMWEEVVVAAVG